MSKRVVHALNRGFTKCGRWITGAVDGIRFNRVTHWRGVTCTECLRHYIRG